MHRSRSMGAVLGIGLVIGLAPAVSSSAAHATASALPRAKSYANCAALQKDYPHGVGLPTARDRTSGTPVTNFTRSKARYQYNDGQAPRFRGERDLDRDNDGVACEKR